MENTNKNTLVYDYKTVKVKREMETITTDVYENLGWELCSTSADVGSIFYVNLSFKRNRKIENKVELAKLQTKVDSALATIEQLQLKQKNAGFVPALITGIAGSLVLGGGMSMAMLLTANIGAFIGGIALGVVGIAICLANVAIYKANHNKQISQIQPLLESELDKLADLCEEASKLTK